MGEANEPNTKAIYQTGQTTNDFRASFPPHPSPLPRGEGAPRCLCDDSEIGGVVTANRAFGHGRCCSRPNGAGRFSLSRRERAGPSSVAVASGGVEVAFSALPLRRVEVRGKSQFKMLNGARAGKPNQVSHLLLITSVARWRRLPAAGGRHFPLVLRASRSRLGRHCRNAIRGWR
jgi:hypothetical protein